MYIPLSSSMFTETMSVRSEKVNSRLVAAQWYAIIGSSQQASTDIYDIHAQFRNDLLETYQTGSAIGKMRLVRWSRRIAVGRMNAPTTEQSIHSNWPQSKLLCWRIKSFNLCCNVFAWSTWRLQHSDVGVVSIRLQCALGKSWLRGGSSAVAPRLFFVLWCKVAAVSWRSLLTVYERKL